MSDHILIVDDKQSIVEILETALGDQAPIVHEAREWSREAGEG